MKTGRGTTAPAPRPVGLDAVIERGSHTSRHRHNRPNILILMSDEHAPQVTGCMGDPLVRTPNLDRLAARGVLFENAYCNNPVCVPGRYSILTGKYPRDIGSLYFEQGMDPSTWTYPKHFAAAGYQTTCVGKMHFQGLEQMHGWMFRPFGDLEIFNHHKMPGTDGDPCRIPRNAPALSQWVKMARPGHDGFMIFDDSVTREAATHLRNYFRRIMFPRYQKDRPLLYQVSWLNPHWPFIAPAGYYHYYRARIAPPAVGRPHRDQEHPYMRAMHDDQLPDAIREEEALNARAAYWGMVQYLDDQIGMVLDVLEELGVLDQFLILYHSDHGDMVGTHGSWGKFSMYEYSVRVPLIISWPGRLPEGKRILENVSLVDVFPTLCDLAGLETPEGVRGGTLLPLMQGEDTVNQRTVISEYYPFFAEQPAVMAKRGDIKLIHYGDEFPDQLFDLRKDPHETENRAGHADYRAIQDRLQAAINALPQPYMWREQGNPWVEKTSWPVR